MRHARANHRRAVHGRESANWQAELVISWLAGLIVVLVALAMVGGAVMIAASAPARSADLDGRHAQSPLKLWFNSLTNKHRVPCCDTADGRRVDDADWETTALGYRVRVDGEWLDVPDDALITAPNRAGYAIVWPFNDGERTKIRCFIAGQMT